MINQVKNYNYRTFQGFYQIGIDAENGRSLQGTFFYVSKILHGWINKKFPNARLPESPKSCKINNTSIIIDIQFDWDKQYYVMKTVHPDETIAGKMWITEASLYVENDKLQLGVKNSFNIMAQTEIDYKNYSCPQFVRTIANTVQLMDAGERIGSVHEINDEPDLESLYNLVLNKKRSFPVIVISEASKGGLEYLYVIEEPGAYFLDGSKLSEELIGIAHVFYLPLNCQDRWNELVGDEWKVYHGAVRTFYPEFSVEDMYYQHPIMIPLKIMSMDYVSDEGKEYYYGHAFRHILAHYIKEKNIYQGIRWENTGCIFMLERERLDMLEFRNSQKDRADYYEFLNKYNLNLEEENKSLINEIEKLRAEKDELKADIYRLNSLNTIAQDRLCKYESLKDSNILEYPTEYDEFAEWVDKEFLGRVVLHKRARRSIKNADYHDIRELCDAIDWLANYYYYFRTGGNITKEETDKRLKQLHMENTPAISDAALGRFEEQYMVDYYGNRRKLEYHIRKGKSFDSRESFRIYYFWDAETQKVVIGDMPKHLDTLNS